MIKTLSEPSGSLNLEAIRSILTATPTYEDLHWCHSNCSNTVPYSQCSWDVGDYPTLQAHSCCNWSAPACLPPQVRSSVTILESGTYWPFSLTEINSLNLATIMLPGAGQDFHWEAVRDCYRLVAVQKLTASAASSNQVSHEWRFYWPSCLFWLNCHQGRACSHRESLFYFLAFVLFILQYKEI